MIKSVLVLFVCFSIGVACSYLTYQHGKQEGMEEFHEACFLIGGYVINKQGQVVACKGQGLIPQEELHNFITL